MRVAGRIAAGVLAESMRLVVPGLTSLELDQRIASIIKSYGAKSAFLGYQGFPAHACISVNEEVIHGIGGNRRFQFGDLVKIDIGVEYDEFIGDVAMSVPVGGCSVGTQKLLDVTSAALRAGILKVKNGTSIVDVSRAIQETVEAAGYSVIREFVGHGVGRKLHEDPQIPNFVSSATRGVLSTGMTIAIEPMVSIGNSAVEILPDGWTVVTKDRSLSAHFEHTVLVTEDGVEILTIHDKALY